MNHAIAYTALALAALTSGCSTTALSQVENRVACTMDRKEAHFLSKWWRFSIGAQIAEADAVVMCRERKAE